MTTLTTHTYKVRCTIVTYTIISDITLDHCDQSAVLDAADGETVVLDREHAITVRWFDNTTAFVTWN